MRRPDCLWNITLVGEASKTFERLLNELSSYVVEVETLDGSSFDAKMIDAHTFLPVDPEGVPVGAARHLGRVAGIHVY